MQELSAKCNKTAFTRTIDNLANNAVVHSEEGKNIEVVLGKKRLAKEYSEDRIAYSEGKSELIEIILREAKAWRDKEMEGARK